MAHNKLARMLVELEIESSDDEDFYFLPPLPPIPDEDNDIDHNELQIFHPILGIIQRIEHVKIQNYVENIVQNYNNIDFIMHFRLSREVTYNLIHQFHVSEIFTSL